MNLAAVVCSSRERKVQIVNNSPYNCTHTARAERINSNSIFLESDWPANILADWIQTGIGSGSDPPHVYPEITKRCRV